jgi:putative polymerase
MSGQHRVSQMNSAITASILIFAVIFNALFAIINGHVVTLERAHVILAEILVYGAAITIVGLNADRKMLPWLLLALFIVLNGLLLSMANDAFNAKYIRDVLVIPVFIMLGMTYKTGNLTKLVLILQTIVFSVALVEAVLPDVYSDTFQILKYYVNTRDFSAGQFWNGESVLFLSATRPGERFFGFVELHRLSSIFLEPVSLGNYCVVIVVLLIACWSQLTPSARVYLTGSTLALLVGCDGRLAALSIVIILLSLALLRGVSSRWSVLYLPVVVLLSAAFVSLLGLSPTGDNFGGRLAGSIVTLSEVGLRGLAGFDTQSSAGAADSGITYFVLTQSLVGVAVIWSMVCLVPADRSSSLRTYIHGIGIFVPLNLMVSYSFFSVKVSALIWFAYGYLFMEDSLADRPSLSESSAVVSRQRVVA